MELPTTLSSPVIRGKMQDAWNLMAQELFCEETSLLYDSLSSHDMKHRFDHLPWAEEIAQQLPNPCGAGTGMEDSMLNSGSAIEAALIRGALEPQHRDECVGFAMKILKGMETCSSVHGVPGYVVRSVSPRDGKSCYINSSRDQFTLYVYGMWLLFHSEFANAGIRQRAQRKLVEVAEYCERTVLPENQNNLLRLDGKPALVAKMIDIEPHEAMRLPMFYAAAYDVSGDKHWLELYRRYAHSTLRQTLAMDQGKSWWSLQLVQMQISLALCRAVETGKEMIEQFKKAMLMAAALAEKHFYQEEAKMAEFAGDWSPFAVHWGQAWKMSLRPDSMESAPPALYFGRLYLKPWEPEAFMDAFERLRGIGNLAVTVALSPEYRAQPDFLRRFAKAAEKPDYAKITSGGVVNMLHGYWLLRRNEACGQKS